MAPGVSRALADYRAVRVAEVRYELRLDVSATGDAARASNGAPRAAPDTVRGHVVVRFRRAAPGDVILDFRGPRLANVRADGVALGTGAYTANGAHVRVPERALRSAVGGESVLEFDFSALAAPAGASVIRVHDAADRSDYLYTLLVPADANQLFPCFDQPDLKARTTLTLVVPRGWSAVSNGTLADSAADERTTTFRFAESRPISTYLIGFAAGPWARVERTAEGRPVTLYVRRSRLQELGADADSIIAANARAARWLETWFGVPFPFPKLDVVLAPAFPFGGMEHPGAIFYNENSFIYRERPTRPQLLGRASTIYHEVAHQWFGDLVTMRWFDDLWLKEGFATYMAAKVQAGLDPASDAWKTFYLRNKPIAYNVDRTLGTVPVWQALDNLDQAKSAYGPIVYNKAPGVLKQLDALVGDTAFRRGLHDFLSAHAYANATWRDLLASVGTAAGRSLGTWGEAYFLRPGMPVVTQTRGTDGVTLAQRASQPSLSGAAPWPIKTEVLFAGGGREVRVPVELRAATTRVPTPAAVPRPDVVFANAGDLAYAGVVLDSASARWALSFAGTVGDPLLRAMLWGTLWDEVRDARLDPARFVESVVAALPDERDEEIVPFLLGRLTRAVNAYLAPARRDRLLPAVERALRAGADDGARSYGVRKAHLDALVAVAGTPAALAALDSLLDRPEAAGAPLRAPTRWAIVTRLVAANASDAERRLAEETARDTTDPGRRSAFVAGAAHPTAAARRAYFSRYLDDPSLNEEWATGSLGAFDDPRAAALSQPYLRAALDTLPWLQRNRRIFYVNTWTDAFLSGQTSAESLGIVRAFLAARRDLPADLRRKVLQGADELERTVAIRRRWGSMSR
ncbi:Peptidase M1 membrane alanine aminopeptidase [Gemmatirosa kalamazoonensis]|uniref:Aminopeptidase N n=1 Tax=Gemmatirosa kalamazoonensis TaxID=861299 RepID=W0RDV0_9BACT|nr:M1 family aminopeptidase [Gemmatirosa kalamazoonensis]AHG88505.1 Peptidase M1 membrane alanine aminopeptidase [Gemmatirosa kalamazoonensis]